MEEKIIELDMAKSESTNTFNPDLETQKLR